MNSKLTHYWPRLEKFVQASQAQVSRVNTYLHSVGQDFKCSLKPLRHTGKQRVLKSIFGKHNYSLYKQEARKVQKDYKVIGQ